MPGSRLIVYLILTFLELQHGACEDRGRYNEYVWKKIWGKVDQTNKQQTLKKKSRFVLQSYFQFKWKNAAALDQTKIP